MKAPYCIIDGVKFKLEEINGVLRFPNTFTKEVDLNKMILDYANGRIKLEEVFVYYTTSGSSYDLVRSIFAKQGGNNHIVKQGKEKPKSFRLFKLRPILKKIKLWT